VVPEHAGTPGHPVVLPCAPFADLRGQAPDGPMRDLLRARARAPGTTRVPLVSLAVDDPGVIADHDAPDAGDRADRPNG